MLKVTATLLLTAMVVACGNNVSPEGQPSMTTSPSSTPGLVDQAKADLSKRLQVPAAEVTLVSSEAVTWSDGSLGCPEPGMFYTQALVDGHRTVLEAGGQRYVYHSAAHRAPFLCEHPQPPTG